MANLKKSSKHYVYCQTHNKTYHILFSNRPYLTVKHVNIVSKFHRDRQIAELNSQNRLITVVKHTILVQISLIELLQKCDDLLS